jgi:hypothetical protein
VDESRKERRPAEGRSKEVDHVNALLAENKALEAERATIEKYKKMYEAILTDPGNAFLFEAGSVVNGSATGSEEEKKGEDTFDAAVDVRELIQGLKLKDLLHDSCNVVGESESVSILSAVHKGERKVALESMEKRAKPRPVKEERVESRRRPSSRKSELTGSYKQEEERVKPRSNSKKELTSSYKGHQNEDVERVKPRSNSKRELTSSHKSQGDEIVATDRVKPRPASKRGELASSLKSDDLARKPRRHTQDPNLHGSNTSHRSSFRHREEKDHKEEKDCASVTSNASSGSRVKGFLSRMSFTSNGSVADDNLDIETDAEDDVVPDLNPVGAAAAEKKKDKGLFGKMKKFGQKVSKALVSSGPVGFKKYKVGEVARYNIGKIRDSLESFDPQDPTVEVVIIAVHIDAVLEIPYYTIQLPDGSRKQTNMENLIPLEDYNNGTRPYTRIKEKRSSSRRRSRREDDDDDDRSVHSNRSSRSTQSNRSTKSSSSRRSNSSRHHRDRSESPEEERPRSSSRKSSSRHRDDGRNGSSRRSKSYRDEDDDNYRPRVDAMRGGGMSTPDKGANLRRSETSSKAITDKDEGNEDEKPVVIKLTSRNSVGSSFALDAAVAAAVGARRSAAMSVNSSSRSCCADSFKSSSFHVPKKSSSFHVTATESNQAMKPPSVVELSPKKTKPAAKLPVVDDTPKQTIKHATSADDATPRRASVCASEQQRRSRSTGPSRQKTSLPHGTCNKCDGCHQAADCPIYLKEREKHKDAWRYYGSKSKKKQMGEDGGNKRVKATRIKQPADGSCLFHSLVYCLNSSKDSRKMNSSASVSSSSSTVSSCIPPPLTAKYLRRKIASYVAANPNLPIADDPLKEWVLWDSGQSVKDYAAAMAVGGWGGGVEIAACSHMYRVNIHVYEADSKSDEYVRISCFNFDSQKTRKTLHVLYHGRNHYDALRLK